jgi:hypothetical protein
MSTEPSLRQLVQEQISTDGEKVDEALLARLLDAAESVAPQPREETASAPPLPPDSQAMVGAALHDTFSLEELGLSTTQPQTRALLAQADTVMIDGLRRLRLQPAAREAMLAQLHTQGRLQGALQELPESEAQDQATRNTQWLHRCLRGQWIDPQTASVEDLRAAVFALEQLHGLAAQLNLPSLDEARRQLGLAEWLEPLRILVGARSGALAPSQSDRFVGRADELRLLRSHVDELDSQSVLESLSRGLQRVSSKVKHLFGAAIPGVLMLEAGGGLGKSTLIAKFILDHARSPQRPVPTVYLDFDRASLQPRQPVQLLRESLCQLSLQFPEHRTDLDRVAASLQRAMSPDHEQALLSALEQAPADTEFADSSAWLDQLHARLRAEVLGNPPLLFLLEQQPYNPLDRLHALFDEQLLRGRSLLLVLDTMEVVQPDDAAMRGIQTFLSLLQALSGASLRIVVAGRASVPELVAADKAETAQAEDARFQRREGSKHVLQPLSVREAQQMVDRLGGELLGEGWNPAWSRCLAGTSRADSRRREPLTLRVAVELVRAVEPEKRDSLARSLENLQADALGGFVGPLYQRRVLDHVRDPEVRKLAWPGLVLRRLTREIAREVLMQPCDIAPQELDRVYDALAREVWIVTREGDALRHRPDLRSRTLPLMREYRDNEGRQPFFAINEAAIRYFAERRHSDPGARAEWIYHRLLTGEPARALENDWSDELTPALIDAAQDFPAGSDAHSFLLARTSRRLLSTERVLALGSRDALEHLARTTHFFRVHDEKINPLLVKMDLSVGDSDLPPALAAVRYALAVKTGRWRNMTLDRPSEYWFESNVLAYLYLLACHAGQPFSVTLSRRVLPAQHRLMLDVRSAFSALTYQLVVLGLASDEADRPAELLSRTGDEAHRSVEFELRELLENDVGAESIADMPLYRLAVSFGVACAPNALLKFIASMFSESVARPQTFAAGEVRALLEPGVDELLREELRIFDQALFSAVDTSEAPRRISSAYWSAAIAKSLRRLLPTFRQEPDSPAAFAIRNFMAARDPHWLLPMSYAAERLAADRKFRGTLIRVAERRLREVNGIVATNLPLSCDMLLLLRPADEAGDLQGMVELLLSHSEGHEDAEDLRYLLACYRTWKQARKRKLGRSLSN